MNAKQLAMLQRRKEVAERYLGFETQTEIGAALGVSQKTVSRDLESLRQEWLTNSKEAIDRIIARQLAKLDLLEAKYWQAWERSLTGREIRSGKIVKNGDAGHVREAGSNRFEPRDGNPIFLHGVERCIRARAEILGIMRPRTCELAVTAI